MASAVTWVTTPVMSNPAGAFAKALFLPVVKAYVGYVMEKYNNITMQRHHKGTTHYYGGAVYHERYN